LQIAGKMSRPSVNSVVIDIAEDQHAGELALVVTREAALRRELGGVPVTSEIFQETRRATIRVMEELAGGREAVEPARALARAAGQRIEHDRRGRGEM